MGLGSLGCTPTPSDLGGTISPPQIDGESPTAIDGNLGIENPGGDATIFDVTIDAVSLFTTGITIEAELRVVAADGSTTSPTPYASVTLQDTVNAPGDEVGIAGGVFLTAGSGVSGSFTLTEGPDGEIVASFLAPGEPNPNRFILPAEGQLFIPGVIGVTYEAQSGSRFDFRIDGDRVTGSIDLSGTPINDSGGTEVYIGSFSGERRP